MAEPAHALPPGWHFCSTGTCKHKPKDVPNKEDTIICERTMDCKTRGVHLCKCNLFSYDPEKENGPLKHEANQDGEFKKEEGRAYECLCTYFVAPPPKKKPKKK